MRIKSPARSLTDNFVDALGKRYPTTLMNWDTKAVGTYLPFRYAQAAVKLIRQGRYEEAIGQLMHPMTNGLEGGPDVSGIVGHCPGASVPPGVSIGWEIKAGTDRQRESQINCQRAIQRHGGIYILVRSVEQGLADTEKYAGPGEKK